MITDDIKALREHRFGWIGPQAQIIACPLFKHLDALSAVPELAGAHAQFARTVSENADYVAEALSSLGPDDHPEMHRFDDIDDEAKALLVRRAYEAGYVRLGLAIAKDTRPGVVNTRRIRDWAADPANLMLEAEVARRRGRRAAARAQGPRRDPRRQALAARDGLRAGAAARPPRAGRDPAHEGGPRHARGQAMTATPFTGTGYHGSRATFASFEMDPGRGIYFASEIRDALDHGPVLYACTLTLANPARFTEAEADSDMEIDRTILMGKGFDGRIIAYGDGTCDYVAFDPSQVEVHAIVSRDAASWTDYGRPRREIRRWCQAALSEPYREFRREALERAFGLRHGHVGHYLAEPCRAAIGHHLALEMARWCAANPDCGPNEGRGEVTPWASLDLG